ncbi:transketolase family protein [Microbacterium sp. NPDC058342]|uniref:transketolase family protein n=1 Tax=Microbacterium sp. NPDC058342 TaxID=3346454 RepID=UPI00365C769A
MKSQRVVWGEVLAELAAEDDRIVVIDGDLATSTRADIVAERVPEAFVEAGIAEQNLVGVAVGMSTVGYRPWLSTFGVFLTHRALDQLRMLVSQTKAPVRVVGSYSGLLTGASGKTHQDLADIAIMRAMPHFAVLAPADEYELEAMMRWAGDFEQPLYLRVARDAVSPVGEPQGFVLGEPRLLRDADDARLVVISTGVQTSRTVEALDIVAHAHRIRHIHLPTLKPLDEDALLDMIGDCDHVVTVEEHSVFGGLGGLISEVLSARAPRRVDRIGLADGWAESAPNEFLLDRYGLSAQRVADRMMELLGGRDGS